MERAEQDNKIINDRDVYFLTVQCQNDLNRPDCQHSEGQYCVSKTGVIHHVMECSSTDSSSEIEIDKKQYSSSEEESSSETDREIEEAKASQLNNDKKPRKNTAERSKPQKEEIRQEVDIKKTVFGEIKNKLFEKNKLERLQRLREQASSYNSFEIEINKKQYSSSEEESSSETDREIEEAKVSQVINDKEPRKNTEERNKPQKERTSQEAEDENLNRIPNDIPNGYYPVYRNGQLGWYMPPMMSRGPNGYYMPNHDDDYPSTPDWDWGYY